MLLNNSELANDTSGHWSDTFNTLERNSILVLELIEWIVIFVGLAGMFHGIEIGKLVSVTAEICLPTN